MRKVSVQLLWNVLAFFSILLTVHYEDVSLPSIGNLAHYGNRTYSGKFMDISTTCNSNNTNLIKSIKFCIWPQVLDMKFTIDALEKERDWYFWKLQTIVVWLRTKCALYWIIVWTLFQSVMQEMDGEMDKQAQDIVDILYATQDGYPDSF